eukprot:TRINITY_DN1331_c0_g1_i2.p1 TRINITY_DN1331_c0_g1~~TRINITY_DN1331_c0_g1_i2.p1  ORF type:complete len:350 (+),score=61.54 TRINITY_DN1331_c0_g1_i2:37-1050(+)
MMSLSCSSIGIGSSHHHHHHHPAQQHQQQHNSLVLPVIEGGPVDLCVIAPQTLVDLLDGHYTDRVSKITIVDCRYPYEYEGGHIRDAVNVQQGDLATFFPFNENERECNASHVVVFHCEFSSVRGPDSFRLVRGLDRRFNALHYPDLHFPQMYVLEGGYRNFFSSFPSHCLGGIVYMLDKGYKNQLKQHRGLKRSRSLPLSASTSSLFSPVIGLIAPPLPPPILYANGGDDDDTKYKSNSNLNAQGSEVAYNDDATSSIFAPSSSSSSSSSIPPPITIVVSTEDYKPDHGDNDDNNVDHDYDVSELSPYSTRRGMMSRSSTYPNLASSSTRRMLFGR